MNVASIFHFSQVFTMAPSSRVNPQIAARGRELRPILSVPC